MLTERYKRMAGLPYDMDKLLIELEMGTPSDAFDDMDPADTTLNDDRDTDPTDRDMSVAMDDGMGQMDATADLDDAGDSPSGITVTAVDDDDISDDADAAADMQDADKMSFADMMAGGQDDEDGEPEDVKLKQLELLQQLISALGLDDMVGGLQAGKDAGEQDMADGDLDDLGGDDAFGGSADDMETDDLSQPEEEEQAFDNMLSNDDVSNHPLHASAPDHAREDIQHLITQMNKDSSAGWAQHKEELHDFITNAVNKAFNGDAKQLDSAIALLDNLGVRGPVYQELRQMKQTLDQGPQGDKIDFDATGSQPTAVDLTGMEVKESACTDCVDVAQGIYTKPAQIKEDKVPNMKVPSEVRSDLKTAISEYKKRAIECADLDQGRDAMFNEQVATVLETIESHLGSDRCDLKRAATFVTSLKGDLVRLIPESVYKYISQAGYERNQSVRAYFDQLKKK